MIVRTRSNGSVVRSRRSFVVWSCAVLILVGRVAQAQSPCSHGRGSYTAQWENDIRDLSFGLGTDEAYTNGVRSSKSGHGLGAADEHPRLSRFFLFKTDEDSCLLAGGGIAHLLFTPKQLETPVLQADDRPYAAWFYLSLELSRIPRVSDPRHGDTVAVDIGILGPGAGGRWLQDRIHRRFKIPSRVGQEYKRPLGWHHQLRNEAGFNLRVLRQVRLAGPPATIESRHWDLVGHSGGSIGNIYTWGLAGAAIRAGINVPNDLGSYRTIPTVLVTRDGRAASGERQWSLYGFAGTEGRLALRNAFLDGNLFATERPDSPHVQKRPFVGDLDVGGAFRFRSLKFTYHNVLRSSEFKTPLGAAPGSINNHAHRYGSLAVSFGTGL